MGWCISNNGKSVYRGIVFGFWRLIHGGFTCLKSIGMQWALPWGIDICFSDGMRNEE